MTEAAIEIRDLQKTYEGGKRALDGITLDVPRGQIFGLLGPNGAGKSTMINILAGLVTKSGGSASIWGFDIDQHPRNAKRSIGVVPRTPRISSSTRAPASSCASPRGAATICRPTGRPEAVKPQGSDSAGQQTSVIA